MQSVDKSFEIHSFYNLSRYLFLRIEQKYSKIIEKSGITLPQLRILWIVNCFPGISLSEMAKIGCWTSPTVTNMIKILLNKNLVTIDKSSNNKTKNLFITSDGVNIININKQKKGSGFPLSDLIHIVKEDELSELINILKYISTTTDNLLIFEYIDKVNALSLKVDYESFDEGEAYILKNLICFYNLLRVYVLTTENNHSLLLKDLNLTYAQLRALKILKAFKGINSKELSEMALWSPSTANLVVKNLLSKDFIYKKKGSLKNSLHIFLTNEGENVIMEDAKINKNEIATLNILNRLSAEKLSNANKILYSLNTQLNNTIVEHYILKTYEKV